MKFSVGFIAALAVATNVEARPWYAQRIPNGNNVKINGVGAVVYGVGHKSTTGGGAQNAFGDDFHETLQWTVELCKKDSDGDGRSNGEELGDPDCVWKYGTQPKYTTYITHPGVVDTAPPEAAARSQPAPSTTSTEYTACAPASCATMPMPEDLAFCPNGSHYPRQCNIAPGQTGCSFNRDPAYCSKPAATLKPATTLAPAGCPPGTCARMPMPMDLGFCPDGSDHPRECITPPGSTACGWHRDPTYCTKKSTVVVAPKEGEAKKKGGKGKGKGRGKGKGKGKGKRRGKGKNKEEGKKAAEAALGGIDPEDVTEFFEALQQSQPAFWQTIESKWVEYQASKP